MKLSEVEIAKVAYKAGFRNNALAVAVAIACAESNGDTAAHGYNTRTHDCPEGSVDRGLFQINDCYHNEVTSACAGDPQCAANAAYRISDSGTNFTPWSTFNSGAYKDHMPAALRAAANVSAQNKSSNGRKGVFHRELDHWHYYGQMDMPLQAGYPATNRENDCGPACLTMCLQHWFDFYLSEDHINILEAGTGHVGYTNNLQMATYLNKAWNIGNELRVPTNAKDAYNYAKKQIGLGYCVINLGDYVAAGATFNHYTVTTGINAGDVIIADPGIGKRIVVNTDQYYKRCYISQMTPLHRR